MTSWAGSPSPKTGDGGFSLPELLIVLAIGGLLAGLLLPALQQAVAKSRDAACQSNLRQIGLAFALYEGDNERALPLPWNSTTGYYWFHNLLGQVKGTTKYLSSPKVLTCPASTGTYTPAFSVTPPTRVSYGMSDLLLWSPSLHRVSSDSHALFHLPIPAQNWPLVMDADGWAVNGLDNPVATAAKDSRFTARHLGWANVLMADGHLERARYGDTRWSQSTLNK